MNFGCFWSIHGTARNGSGHPKSGFFVQKGDFGAILRNLAHARGGGILWGFWQKTAKTPPGMGGDRDIFQTARRMAWVKICSGEGMEWPSFFGKMAFWDPHLWHIVATWCYTAYMWVGRRAKNGLFCSLLGRVENILGHCGGMIIGKMIAPELHPIEREKQD